MEGNHYFENLVISGHRSEKGMFFCKNIVIGINIVRLAFQSIYIHLKFKKKKVRINHV